MEIQEITHLSAPSAPDNQTVILWVVTVLVAVVVLLARAFWNKMESNEARCREENEKSNARADEAIRQVQTIQSVVIMEQTRTQVATNAMNEKVSSILSRLCNEVRRASDTIRTPVPNSDDGHGTTGKK